MVALIALVALLARGSRDAALEPRVPLGAREGVLESNEVEPQPVYAERSPAGDSANRDASATASLALRGSVLDAAGTPVTEAAVEAVPEWSAAEQLAEMGRTEVTGRTASTTLVDGTFELRVEDTRCTYRLQVMAEGYFPAFVDALVPGGAPVTVRLRAAPSLQGSVHTTTGRAVVGARVRLLARTSFGERLELETLSDESGKYRLSGGLLDLEHLEDPLLDASATGFAPSRVPLRDFALLLTRAPTLDVLERDLVLSPGNRFTGHVRDAAGAPVAGAELVVFTHAGRDIIRDPYGTTRSSGLGPTAIVTTRSGPDGGFVLEALPVRTGDGASDWRTSGTEDSMGSVRAQAEGFALGGARLPWTNEGEPTEPLEIVLQRSASFTGRVVDAVGRPLAEAKVGIQLTGASLRTIVPNGMLPDGFGELLYWSPGEEVARIYLWVRGGADGRFRSPALPCARAGTAQVRFQLSWCGEDLDWRELELHAGEERELGDIALALRMVQVAIEGIVLDRDGAPVAGAEVQLQDAGMRRTDRGGRFSFERGMSPAEAFPSLDLEVRARGFVTHREVLSTKPESPLEIRLLAGRELRGTLSFEDGSPAAGGSVRFERPRQPGRNWVWSDVIGRVKTDALGRFAFGELPAPPWVIEFGVDRNGFALEGRLTVNEPSGDLALVLRGILPEFASLELSVSDSSGRPVESVQHPGLVSDAERVAGLVRDARTIVFPEVAPGRYELQLGATGFAAHTQELELAPGELERVDVTLEVGARVRVRVSPPPALFTSLRVVAESAAHATRSRVVEAGGLADLGVLAHGTWQVGLVAREAASGAQVWLGPTRTLEVPVGESSLEWDFARPELGRVRLELPVRRADDPPIPTDDFHSGDSGSLAASDRMQAWSSAHQRYAQRAEALTIELQDDTGIVLSSAASEEVQLDARRNRVLGVVTAPVGRYTLVLRRGTEHLRRSPVQVLPDTLVELDP